MSPMAISSPHTSAADFAMSSSVLMAYSGLEVQPVEDISIDWVAYLPQASHLTNQSAFLVAQSNTQFNQDVVGDISSGFKHFFESGQVWALLVGLVIGYMIRSMTAY